MQRIRLRNLVLRQASGHIYMSKRSYHELTDSETVKTGKVPLEPNEHCEQETTVPWSRFYGLKFNAHAHFFSLPAFLRSKVSPVVQSSGPVQWSRPANSYTLYISIHPCIPHTNMFRS